MSDEIKQDAPKSDAPKPNADAAKPSLSTAARDLTPAKVAETALPKPKPKKKSAPEPPRGPEDQAPPDEMEAPPAVAALQAAVPGAVEHVSFWVGDWTVIVSAGRLLDVMRFLRDDDATALDYCSDITATDWPPREQRFDVIYCLYSTRLRHRLRVKVRASEDDPIESVTGLWPGANWLEREVYDQFGVNIVNHPDLRRILMPDEWQGHPQRKDYPLEGPGELLMESPQDWLRLRNSPFEAMDDGEIE